MRKQVFGRQLKRDFNERKALFKSLLSSLILKGRIKTTEAKAKAIKGEAEKMVTKVKKGANKVEALLSDRLTQDAVKKLISDVAPRFSQRNGGYTRIMHLGRRFTDGAKMSIIEWAEKTEDQKSNLKDQKQEEDKNSVTVSADSKKNKTVVAKKTR